jgi:hypothetical protein
MRCQIHFYAIFARSVLCLYSRSVNQARKSIRLNAGGKNSTQVLQGLGEGNVCSHAHCYCATVLLCYCATVLLCYTHTRGHGCGRGLQGYRGTGSARRRWDCCEEIVPRPFLCFPFVLVFSRYFTSTCLIPRRPIVHYCIGRRGIRHVLVK